VVIWQSFRECRCPACSAYCALAYSAELWEALKAVSNVELKNWDYFLGKKMASDLNF